MSTDISITILAWLPLGWVTTRLLMRKTNQFAFRLDAELLAAVEECCKHVGMEPANLLRELLKAFVEEVRHSGQLALPFSVVARKELAELRGEPFTVPGNVLPIHTAKKSTPRKKSA